MPARWVCYDHQVLACRFVRAFPILADRSGRPLNSRGRGQINPASFQVMRSRSPDKVLKMVAQPPDWSLGCQLLARKIRFKIQVGKTRGSSSRRFWDQPCDFAQTASMEPGTTTTSIVLCGGLDSNRRRRAAVIQTLPTGFHWDLDLPAGLALRTVFDVLHQQRQRERYILEFHCEIVPGVSRDVRDREKQSSRRSVRAVPPVGSNPGSSKFRGARRRP